MVEKWFSLSSFSLVREAGCSYRGLKALGFPTWVCLDCSPGFINVELRHQKNYTKVGFFTHLKFLHKFIKIYFFWSASVVGCWSSSCCSVLFVTSALLRCQTQFSHHSDQIFFFFDKPVSLCSQFFKSQTLIHATYLLPISTLLYSESLHLPIALLLPVSILDLGPVLSFLSETLQVVI